MRPCIVGVMGVASPAPRREDRVAALARALRALAELRDEASLARTAAAAIRAVTGARSGLVWSQGAVTIDGPDAPPDGTRLALALDAAPAIGTLVRGPDTRAYGFAAGTVDQLLVVPVGAGRRWLCAVDRLDGDFADTERDLLAAIAAQVAASDEVIALVQRSRVTESKYRALVEQMPAVTYYRPLDAPGEASFISPQVEQLTGYTPAELIAEPDLWRQRLHPDDRADLLKRQAGYRPGAERAPVVNEYRLLHKDGHIVWIRNHSLAVRDDRGQARFVLGLLFDVTASREAEAARRSSEAKLRHIADANVIGILTATHDGTVTEANDAFLSMVGHGRDEVSAGTLRLADLSPPESPVVDVRFVQELRERGRTDAIEQEFVRGDGSRVPVLLGAARVPGGDDELVAFVLDLSDRKRLEERLRQSQKMDAIGQLAGGVAHDFNNVLSVILTYGELLIRQLREGDPIRADVEEIVAAGERAKALTRQLLAFSRRQVLQPRVIDLGDVVVTLEPMLRRLLGEDVALDVRRSQEPCRARVDPTQIEQVILNLAVNARDAMPEGGRLTIEVASAEVDEGPGAVELAAGTYVTLTVTDTGIGMDDATRVRMFEPFFTTKPLGKGTGLGLATVFGIVQQSGGAVTVRSAPGKGTALTVHVPRTDAPPSISQPMPAMRLRGDETILLTEDDDQLRRLARVALQQHGYQVLEAANGGEALLLCEQHDGAIALLLTDVVLPRMSGRHLAERLQPLRPAMKVLYMTGYTDDAIVRHGVDRGDVPLLQKPFTADELLGRVRRVLDGLVS
jgi:two-component system cell cycle sensor histidine kinase/response regulator CckA